MVEEEFKVCPKFDKHDLSDDQIEEIATRAAARAITMAKDDFYRDVGKNIVNKVFWLIGFLAFVGFMYAVKKGWISI